MMQMNRKSRVEKLFLMNGNLSTVIHHSLPDRFIVCCHGLYSSKESKKYVEMAKMAGKKDISVIRFDFRGCGESAGGIHDSTLGNRAEDLRQVIKYVRRKFNSPKIALFGSSLGGMVAIVVSATDSKISSLAVLSTPCEIKGDLGMGEEFMEDLKNYDILEAVKRVPPILVIHGRNDELVPVEHAERIYAGAPKDKKIMFFDADHSFSVFRKEALAEVLKWMEKHF